MREHFSYKKAGVDIEIAADTKRAMARSLETGDKRVLNKIGAFASLFDATFPEYEHPVLVLKTDEPGSKQKLAFKHNRISSICYDLVNHLVNDVIVMGATPLTVLDVVVCGKLEKEVVLQIVESISQACKEQGCVLVGGETSEQPVIIEAGTYVLAGSIVGVGMTVVVDNEAVGAIQKCLSKKGCDSYLIGHITRGEKRVVYQGMLAW